MLSKTDTEIIQFLADLDSIARDYDSYEYGLPYYNSEQAEIMINLFRKFTSNPPQDINEIIEARKKQFAELKK